MPDSASADAAPEKTAPEKTAPEKTIDIEVRYAETDQMGVVHHSNHIVWFELARTHLCNESGWHYADIERAGLLLMVTGAEVRYLRPARYGDVVQVTCRVGRMASRALRFEYEVSKDGELLATGATDHLWVSKETGRPSRPTEEIRAAFESVAERFSAASGS